MTGSFETLKFKYFLKSIFMNYFSDIVYRGKTVSDIRNELENFIRLFQIISFFSPSLLSPLLPITSCAVEIDIVANEILNPILSSNGSKKIFNSSFLKILFFFFQNTPWTRASISSGEKRSGDARNSELKSRTHSRIVSFFLFTDFRICFKG